MRVGRDSTPHGGAKRQHPPRTSTKEPRSRDFPCSAKTEPRAQERREGSQHSKQKRSAAAKLSACHTHHCSLSLLPPTHSPCCHPSPPLSSVSHPMRQVQGGGCEASAGAICNDGAKLSVFGKGGGSAAKNCLPVTSAIAHCPYHHSPPPFVNLTSYTDGSGRKTLEPL